MDYQQENANSAAATAAIETAPAATAQERLASYGPAGLQSVRCDEMQGKENRGTVVLSGIVTSFYHKQLALEIVRRCGGIDLIINELQVTSYR